MIDSENILSALRNVKHPESGQDIVSLGMVDNIKIDNKKVGFSLIFKKSNDPFIKGIVKACEQSILKNIGSDVQISGNIEVKVPERKPTHGNEQVNTGSLEKVKNIVAIASGKGGVGKSTMSVNLAISLAHLGAKVGLIDADIFGPSLPKMFGVEGERPRVTKRDNVDMVIPVEKYGVKMLSIGFFINPEDALVWRGAMATNALKQLIHQGEWGELDYLLIDLPPGTSDIHLTLVQELAVTGAIVVSTPQDVALADALKGIKMFTGKHINVPILGLIENMAWFTPEELPDNKYYIFGKGGVEKLAKQEQVDLLGQIPIVQSIREGGDEGNPPAYDTDSIIGKVFGDLANTVRQKIKDRNLNIEPTQKVEIKHK